MKTFACKTFAPKTFAPHTFQDPAGAPAPVVVSVGAAQPVWFHFEIVDDLVLVFPEWIAYPSTPAIKDPISVSYVGGHDSTGVIIGGDPGLTVQGGPDPGFATGLESPSDPQFNNSPQSVGSPARLIIVSGNPQGSRSIGGDPGDSFAGGPDPGLSMGLENPTDTQFENDPPAINGTQRKVTVSGNPQSSRSIQGSVG